MKILTYLKFITILIVSLFCLSSHSDVLEDEVNYKKGKKNLKEPIRVKIDFIIDEIDTIDLTEMNYEIIAEVLLEWSDIKLAKKILGNNNKPIYFSGEETLEIPENIKLPIFAILNEEQPREHIIQTFKVFPDGTLKFFEKFSAKLTIFKEMESYPFGELPLRVDIKCINYKVNDLLFIPDKFLIGHNRYDKKDKDGKKVKANVIRDNWQSTKHEYESIEKNSMNLGGGSFSKVSYKINLIHDYKDIATKILLPLLLVMFISNFINEFASLQFPANADWRIGGQITLILTILALKFSLGSDIPRPNYLTLIDAIFVSATTIVSVNLLCGIFLNNAFQRKQTFALRLEKQTNWVLPFFAIFLLIWVSSYAW